MRQRFMAGLVRPVVATALSLMFVGAVPAPAGAAGSTYNLIRCHSWNRTVEPADTWAQGGYTAHGNKCGQNVSDWSYQIKSTSLVSGGRSAAISWSAPPGTAISFFALDHDTRTADKHYAEIQVGDFGGGWTTVYRAPNDPGPFRYFSRGGLWHQGVRVVLYCSASGGCAQSDAAHAFARNVHLQLADAHDPSLSTAGALLSAGWKRGSSGTLSASAADFGSGIRRLDAVVNGVALGLPSGANCNGQAAPWTALKVPCGGAGFNTSPNTASGPFRNGDNALRILAEDFAGNTAAVDVNVKVDNARPALVFASDQDPEDPELIRAFASDQHSGLATAKLYMRAADSDDWQPLSTTMVNGEVHARVDSLSVPAGDYEFRAVANDVAGNTTETTSRANGQTMKLTLPLRSPVVLETNLGGGASKGQTVPYGTGSVAKGRLTDESGEPLTGRHVLVVENFGDGALIRERPTMVTTDERGRWSTKLPAGPTRSVTASFAGTKRFAPEERNVGKLTVKSRATFRARRNVAEGRHAVFKGKVGHFGARIPSGGKLLELQVRLKTGRWDTVGEAFRTRENGRYRRSYRFGKHYTEDALFRFRVKVQKERNWPYKRGASTQQKVTVRAR